MPAQLSDQAVDLLMQISTGALQRQAAAKYPGMPGAFGALDRSGAPHHENRMVVEVGKPEGMSVEIGKPEGMSVEIGEPQLQPNDDEVQISGLEFDMGRPAPLDFAGDSGELPGPVKTGGNYPAPRPGIADYARAFGASGQHLPSKAGAQISAANKDMAESTPNNDPLERMSVSSEDWEL